MHEQTCSSSVTQVSEGVDPGIISQIHFFGESGFLDLLYLVTQVLNKKHLKYKYIIHT